MILERRVLLPEEVRAQDRMDCTVKVGCIGAKGNNFSVSYMDWNLPKNQRVFMRRTLEILRNHGGQMHYFDFMREWKRRYGEHG